MNNETKPVGKWPGRAYQRTPEDEENDRLEREWKNRRNQEALRSLTRHHQLRHNFPRGR